jgi:hypothetical protein
MAPIFKWVSRKCPGRASKRPLSLLHRKLDERGYGFAGKFRCHVGTRACILCQPTPRELIERRKAWLASILRKPLPGSCSTPLGDVVFKHACALGCEGIVCKRFGSRYRSGRTRASSSRTRRRRQCRREAEEDWGGRPPTGARPRRGSNKAAKAALSPSVRPKTGRQTPRGPVVSICSD